MIFLIEQTAKYNKDKGDWFVWNIKSGHLTSQLPATFFAHDFRSWFLKVLNAPPT